MLLLKGLVGGLAQLAFIGIFLLIPAGLISGGTWYWPKALMFLLVYGIIQELAIGFLAIKAPSSLEARLKPISSTQQSRADKTITRLFILLSMAWWAFIAIDVFYLKLLPAPSLLVTYLGAVLGFIGFLLITATIYQNSFAIAIVEDQSEKGQQLVDTGLYAFVRHPMYIGVVIWVAGIALWLESFAGFLAVTLFLLLFVVRIRLEEKTLRSSLPDYPDYMKKVKYRLVPFIW